MSRDSAGRGSRFERWSLGNVS